MKFKIILLFLIFNFGFEIVSADIPDPTVPLREDTRLGEIDEHICQVGVCTSECNMLGEAGCSNNFTPDKHYKSRFICGAMVVTLAYYLWKRFR